MPVTPTYPGVYIEEVPSGVRTITGVATAITAFVGRALRGPVDEPTRVQSFGDYDRAFGGLWFDSTMSYAVRHFFQNGGTDAIIVRCFREDATDGVATSTLQTGTAAQGTLILVANPADGDTMTIGAKPYRFQTVLTDADGNIKIGNTLAETQANIVAAINLTGRAGDQYAASMIAHADVRAVAGTGSGVALTAQAAGAGGNALATTSAFTPPSSAFDAATLGTTRAGADAVAAQGTLTLNANPSDNDTMTIGGRTYQFQAVLTDVDGNIQIGGTLAGTQANIRDAINLTGTPGTQYANATVVHASVTAGAAWAGNNLVLTAQAPGAAGNAIQTSANFTAGSNGFVAPAATLGNTTAGADATAAQGTLTLAANPLPGDTLTIGAKVYTFDAAPVANTDGHVQIGATLAETQDNLRAAINRSGAPAGRYAATMTEHPDVSASDPWSGNELVLTADATGAAGNAIATTATLTGQANRFEAATLAGGADGTGGIVLEAATSISGTSQQSPGAWGNNLRVTIDYNVKPNNKPADDPNAQAKLFNIEIREIDPDPSLPPTAPPRQSEKFHNVSVDPRSDQNVDLVLRSRSLLARVRQAQTARPMAVDNAAFSGGNDGQELQDAQISDPGLEGRKQGLWGLQKADLFNLLCIPPLTFERDIGSGTRDAAATYCSARRAFYIMDSPMSWTGVAAAVAGVDALNLRDKNAAVYFPRVWMADPLRDNQPVEYAPCGVIAGIYARTDARRGVWKAPAGTDATMTGVRRMSVQLTDGENGQLNPLGINCLRTFRVIGNVVWGARTLEGADQLSSEWKYTPVRRTALYIEETLFRSLQWVVFEPNDEPLWSQIRLNVGSFMHTLFRQGAFQGSTPKDAYLVKCDSETTTQADIDRGIVNILVGFAPLKPAEFVFVRIQQLAGQLQT